jgi:anti-sigma B factor antagonist
VVYVVDVAEFSVRTETDGDRCIVAVGGELDAQTAPQLTAEAGGRLDTADFSRVVVDLSDVTFLDSTGIAALVRLRNKALDIGKQLALRSPGPRVLKVLQITALDTIFEIEPAHTA